MPTIWMSLKRSLHCKSEPCDVYDPKARLHLNTISTRKAGRSGCSRSIANLKDVIHGSKKSLERPPSCSPRSIGSSEFLSPLTHEVVLNNSNHEFKITGFGAFHEGDNGVNSTYVGTLKPGTPGPGGHHRGFRYNPSPRAALRTPSKRTSSQETVAIMRCHKCGEDFGKWESLEAHHLSNHAVTELLEGDSSRKIVEIICRTSWLKNESSCGRIERVLKVHNMPKTLGRFEEHREMVKNRASKLPKKHPRCLADGNELLRFYGTTIVCTLGMNASSSLCASEKCNVCRIIRHGFSTKKDVKKGGVGVFTTATSGRAFESINVHEDHCVGVRKALLVCRVIAGRVHKPLDSYQELARQSGFDSVAGKVGLYANIEELYLLNPLALLPCFIVICRP
ncbi:putative transcription factor C2H2 family [Dioscorea sansibarensis]